MTIAIGDIHGCRGALERLIPRLPPDEPLVFLGDYIDRGPDSAGVVDTLLALARKRECTFLMGNHEDLLLGAIADWGRTSVWLMNGGDATLRSYGTDPGPWSRASERAEPFGVHLPFYEGLALYHEDEHHLYVHAGVDPEGPPIQRQQREVLLWIRERFLKNTGAWRGKPVVFGHTPTHVLGLPPGQVFQAGGCWGIDTGCVYGGCLTAMDTATGTLYQEPC